MARNLFTLVILALFVYVTAPLIQPVAMGAVLAVLFFPWMAVLERRKIPSAVASGLLTLGMTLVFLLPASFLIFVGAKAGFGQLKAWKDAPAVVNGGVVDSLLGSKATQQLIVRVTHWLPISADDLISTIQDFARTIGLKLADFLGSFVSQLPVLAMAFAIMVLSIYFFLLDGRKVVFFIRRNSFFNSEQTESLIQTFGDMCRSVILATVISGFVQSLLYTLTCLFVDAGNLALIGFAVFITSFIPLIGSVPVTFGVGFQQLIVGNRTGGIALLIMATTVMLLDNVIRPWVLKGAGNLHPLLAFIAVFGGIQVLGFSGIFLGPILAGLFVTVLGHFLITGKKA